MCNVQNCIGLGLVQAKKPKVLDLWCLTDFLSFFFFFDIWNGGRYKPIVKGGNGAYLMSVDKLIT